MLWAASDIQQSTVEATDGSVGSIVDLLFEDGDFTIRWAVVDTGTWLPGRQVLLPPEQLAKGSDLSGGFRVSLTRQQVKDSPPLSSDKPVSRQMETDLYSHYGWAPYWSGPFGYAPVGYGLAMPPAAPDEPGVPSGRPHPPGGNRDAELAAREAEDRGDPHLRSAGDVNGYYIAATDGDIGHVEDLLVDDDSWAVRYLIIDTKNWWPGRKVLISPRWVQSISWHDQQVHLDMTRAQIKESPEYTPQMFVDRDYETKLHGHYDRPPYWV
jgi:hypothetical protein